MKHSTLLKRFTALTLAGLLILSAAACKKTDPAASQPGDSSSQAGEAGIPAFVNPLPGLDLNAILEVNPPSVELFTKISDKQKINKDVVGWLRVPGTDINEEVLQGPGKDGSYDVRKLGEYYERRDLTGQYNFYGCYFADYENAFGDRNGISKSTIIYGHSMTDDLEKDKDPNVAKFTPIKHYNDPEFAAKNPYIYFSTPEDDMVWKVFAGAYTEVTLPYYYPDRTGAQFMSLINEMMDRSELDFNVDVNVNDKILILSTCTYIFGDTEKERRNYRYIVGARLVRPDEEITETNTVTVNETVKKPKVPMN